MPSYTKSRPSWENLPSTDTPIRAEDLENFDQGIADANDAIDAHLDATTNAHTASEISTVDEFATSNSTNVQDVLDDIDAHANTTRVALNAHLGKFDAPGVILVGSDDFADPDALPIGTAGQFLAVDSTAAGLEYVDAPTGGGGGGGGLEGFFNVKDYGAVGDGATDDAAAIQAAITAMPSPGGVLYFPAGDYKITTAINLNKPGITVQGLGIGSRSWTADAPARIKVSSATINAFYVTANGCAFRDIAIYNSNYNQATLALTAGGTRPTAGAGVYANFSGATGLARVDIDGVQIVGFYRSLLIDGCSDFLVSRSIFSAFVNTGVHLTNTPNTDFGDYSINGCTLLPVSSYSVATYSVYATHIGGLRVSDCKFNSGTASGSAVTHLYVAAPTDTNTSVAVVTGNSFEGYTTNAINIAVSGTGSYRYVTIGDNEIAPYVSGANGIAISGTSVQPVKGVSIVGNVMHGEASTGTAITLAYVDNATLNNAYDGWNERFSFSSCTDVKRGAVSTVSAYAAGTQTVAHAAAAQVAFSAEFFEDVAAMHDNSTNNDRFVAKYSTRCRLSGWLTIDNVKNCYGYVKKNRAGPNLDSPFMTSPAAADYPSITLRFDTGWVELVKGDDLSLGVYVDRQGGTGNATITGGVAQFEMQG